MLLNSGFLEKWWIIFSYPSVILYKRNGGNKMKLNSNYSSDISSLLDIKRNDSIFISTWNKDEEINPFPNAKIIEYNQLNSSQVSDYYFSE